MDMMKVLVIDDDDVARTMLCELLEDAGMQVAELPSAIGASKAIVSDGIDVVVVDLFMPNMNGDKLAKLVRGNPRTAHVGIVIVSGMEHAELERLRGEADADAALRKEEVRQRLVTTLKKVNLSRRRTHSEPVRRSMPIRTGTA